MEMIAARMRWGINLVEREEEPQIPVGFMLPACYLILPFSPPLLHALLKLWVPSPPESVILPQPIYFLIL